MLSFFCCGEPPAASALGPATRSRKDEPMGKKSGAAGLAALSVCEAILLSLTDNEIIDQAEAKAILTDAAVAHRHAAPLADGAGGEHEAAAAVIEAIRDGGNSVRRTRPVPAIDGMGLIREHPD